MSLPSASRCYGICDEKLASFCARSNGESENASELEFQYDADFAGNYDGMLSSEYDVGADLEHFEEEYGSYASVAGDLSHVGSQLEFEEFEAFSNEDEKIQPDQESEIQEELNSELLDSFACMRCRSFDCGICFPSDLPRSPDTVIPSVRRPGPLAAFYPGQWFRRRTSRADDKQHALDGAAAGFARFNPLRQHRVGCASELEMAAAQQEDEKLAARRFGWGMGLGRLRRARRVSVVQCPDSSRPTKRHFFVILVCVCVLVSSLCWRQLGLRRIALRAMRFELEEEQQVCQRSTLSAGPWRYCGPHNGHDFSRVPVDTLDAICAQHDFCIEKAEYVVQGQRRRLYPMGEQDEDNFLRCGIPMRSHTDPNYGCQINACDAEMFNSLHAGFSCSPDPSLPKSPWCSEAGLQARRACSEYYEPYKPLLLPRYLACKAVARVSQAYHGWKIRNTCSFMSQHVQEALAALELQVDLDDDARAAADSEVKDLTGKFKLVNRGRFRRLAPVTRLLRRAWNALRRRGRGPGAELEGGGAASGPGPGREGSPSLNLEDNLNWLPRAGGWNCTCQAPDLVRFTPPPHVEQAWRRITSSSSSSSSSFQAQAQSQSEAQAQSQSQDQDQAQAQAQAQS